MQLGVIADTHDNVDAVQAAVRAFEDAGVETIIHCGDVIAPPVIQYFEGFELHVVLGNNDGEITGLRQAIDGLGHGSRLHGRFARLTVNDLEIAVLHGEDLAEVEAYANTGAFAYVLHGHHHEALARDVGHTTVLNPGAHFPSVSSEHRSIAIIDTHTGTHRFVSLD